MTFQASSEPKTDHQIYKYYMSYITEWIQQTRPDTVADNYRPETVAGKHKQNMKSLLCNKYKGDVA